MILALLAACSAGTSDFLGGLGARRAPGVLITAASQVTGFVAAVAFALVVGGEPTAEDLWWGALGGLGGAVGLFSIYEGYAKASVAITAPLAGVGAAAVPVMYDVATGDPLTALTTVGIVVGLMSIGLVSLQTSGTTGGASVTLSLLYGLGGAAGLGFLLVCLAQTSDDGGVWPVAPARLMGFVFMAVIVGAGRVPVRIPRSAWWMVVGVGVLGTAANALFVVATQHGSVSTAAVLTAMFPAVTVLLARIVLHEHLRPIQVAGLALALVAVGLIAGG